MPDKTTNIADNQYERLLNQLASVAGMLEATGRQMQDLACQFQAAGNSREAGGKAFPLTQSATQAARNTCPNDADEAAQAAAIQRQLNARIDDLVKSAAQKDHQITGLRASVEKLKAELAEKTRANAILQKDCDEIDARFKEQWHEAARTISVLENTQGELDNARIELQGISDSLKKYQDEFARIQGAKFRPLADSLAHIPDDIRPMVQSYYEINNLPEFLTQCGHFGRLARLWQSCRSNIVNGENLAGIGHFLAEILKIYNNAFPENPGEELNPESGSFYDAATQERMGGGGTAGGARIARVILPGLRKPGGELAVKALVTLE